MKPSDRRSPELWISELAGPTAKLGSLSISQGGREGSGLLKVPYNCELMACFPWFKALFHVLHTHGLLRAPSSPVRQVHYGNLCCTEEETEAQGG